MPARHHEPEVSHNLVGQKLGRKGQETRERILAAALRLLEQPGDAPVTLTGVAREATVGITSVYLYFPDLGDLVLAALRRVMVTADAAFVDRLRTRWPTDRLGASCLDFLHAHHAFWARNARILQLRNSYADACDPRFLSYRNQVSRPLIDLLAAQMDGSAAGGSSECVSMASVLTIGLERIATIATNPAFHASVQGDVLGGSHYVDALLRSEAELIALAIRHKRAAIMP